MKVNEIHDKVTKYRPCATLLDRKALEIIYEVFIFLMCYLYY